MANTSRGEMCKDPQVVAEFVKIINSHGIQQG